MSGWDEGAVYYSDQAQFPNAGTGDPESASSRHSILRKFKEFIRGFETDKNVYPYRESLVQNPKSLLIDMEDLDSFDADLPSKLRAAPADYFPLFETAAAEVLAGLKSKVAGETGEMEEPVTGEIQILLASKEDSVSMRSLGAQYISRLVKISGITIAASRVKAKATYVSLLCKNCKNVKIVPCKPGLGGAIVPRSCDHIPQPGEEPCPLDPWIVVPDKSKYVDQQTLKLQENPEDVPTGELPRNILLSVDRNLVQTIVPGTRLTILGIYSIFQASNASTSHKGAVAIRQPYIRVVGIEDSNESNSRGHSAFTQDEIEEFKKFASDADAYENICSKIAPSIFGHEDVKKAVACLLFSGSRKTLPDGVRLRGDINVLLLGDPSTAKSQFLKFVEKTAPIAVYTSGKGSSAAGLTASVIQDNSTREFYLEGGAMVLADGGVVCIDEFDKMRPEDRVAIHEAMEQQTISIAKAGITTVLNSRTSVLAAANPPSGRYDDLKTAQDNIDLQTTILSRFDLIFIVKDIRKYNQDKIIASHIIKVHASAYAASGETKTFKEDNWLKRYLQYCRSECHPRLSDSAATMLQNNYVKIRQDMRQQANETGEAAAIPITVRQLEAIIRLSESLAKMRLLTRGSGAVCHVLHKMKSEVYTMKNIEEFKKFASDADAYENICSKIAPSIFGHEDVKKAVACLLFSGSRKTLPDGVRLRGDINVLLLGDPSTAKSQFLKFVEKTAPIAVYTSGKGSSAAGLTASVIQDNSTREFYLEGGAMVLADGGVVCIDEFDKMRPEDRVAIHEAMEQQTISIAKAGITTVLNSRTSVLAAANPPSGRYDDLKTAQDNIDLQTTILSRFDLIFIVKDIRKYNQDKIIASHIIKVHASAYAASGETKTFKEDNWLKRYLQYCRSECHPRLSDSAATMLQNNYVKIRQDMRQQANETGEAAAIPITVRQLEAIIRLSESLAKMRLSHVATEDNVLEAIRLFNVSTMDAAKSGINQHIHLTPETANEIKQAETQIKRRLGIGNHISERRLLDELTRMGMNESIVRRALIIMHQRDEVEYKRERRVILRKA